MAEFVVEERRKLNGKVRFVVLYQGRELGSFYSQANAHRFISREAIPTLVGRG